MKYFIQFNIFFLILICGCDLERPGLEEDFLYPPQSAKTQVWWHWKAGNISCEGITKDLEAMKVQGIGGATIFNLGGKDSVAYGPVDFLSDDWKGLFHYAVKEAERLGLTLGIHNCDGWATSGGPWITPELSMKKVVWKRTRVKGGKLIEMHIPRHIPDHRKLHNGEYIPDFYRDIVLLAVREKGELNSFQKNKPRLILSNGESAERAVDGDPNTTVDVSLHPTGIPKNVIYELGDTFNSHIDIEFKNPYRASQLILMTRQSFPWSPIPLYADCELSYSTDGKSYSNLVKFRLDEWNGQLTVDFPEITAKFFRLRFVINENYWVMLLVNELELLPAGESPDYNPAISNLEPKTGGSIKPRAEMCYSKNNPGNSERFIPLNEVIDLSDKLDKSGNLSWEAPEGNWKIYRFGYMSTGVFNHPATPSGEGLESDKMSKEATEIHFNNLLKKLTDITGTSSSKAFQFTLIDSWEAEFQTWTEQFANEFKQRREYSCIQFLPVMAGEIIGNVDESERFLHDFRNTISDLIVENYYEHFSNLCHANGLELHAEAIYGSSGNPPVDVLKCNEVLDVPMNEFWAHTAKPTRKIVESAKSSLQSSAYELFDKKILAAEAFTLSNATYQYDFYELKDLGDGAFCNGVNRFVLHSYTHQPDDRKPGWTMGGSLGTNFNRNNTWWNQASGWLSYTNRCQALLQRGHLNFDVCYFYGDNIPHFEGNQTLTKLPLGYRSITCNPEVIKNQLEVKNGNLVLSNGNTFKILVLPERETMEFHTLEKLAELVQKGAVIMGPKPERTLSLSNYNGNDQKLQELAESMWGKIDGLSVTENSFGKGKVIWGKSLQQVFGELNIPPDLEWNSRGEKANLIYIHRKDGDTDFYFIANQNSHSVSADCFFRMDGKQPEIWHPETGEIKKVALFNQNKNRTIIPLKFGPREAYFVVFRNKASGCQISSVELSGEKIYPSDNSIQPANWPDFYFSENSIQMVGGLPGDYTLITDKGIQKDITVSKTSINILIAENWKVSFDPEWGLPEPVNFYSLRSWTEHKIPEIKYYSGTAIYSQSFTLPDSIFRINRLIKLHLGQVKNIAEVKLNGKELGILWKPPFKIDITKAAKPGGNQLEVSVTNVWFNRLVGDLNLPQEKRKTWTTYPYEQFLKKDTSLLESGLLGPVKLHVSDVIIF